MSNHVSHDFARKLAELHGNADIAAWLLQHGARDELSSLERFVSACARGDRPSAEAMLTADPALRAQLRGEHHLTVHVQAERGDAAALETLLSCGFDPAVKDRDGVTPLHRAAMFGHAEAARVLLAHGAPADALEGMFAGTPLEWNAPEKTPDPESMQEQLAELCRAAAASTP
ncbi:MAG: ankyrin repeat domain-containing protein [Steroidobacteraceae bacterium]